MYMLQVQTWSQDNYQDKISFSGEIRRLSEVKTKKKKCIPSAKFTTISGFRLRQVLLVFLGEQQPGAVTSQSLVNTESEITGCSTYCVCLESKTKT